MYKLILPAQELDGMGLNPLPPINSSLDLGKLLQPPLSLGTIVYKMGIKDQINHVNIQYMLLVVITVIVESKMVIYKINKNMCLLQQHIY